MRLRNLFREYRGARENIDIQRKQKKKRATDFFTPSSYRVIFRRAISRSRLLARHNIRETSEIRREA